MTIEQSLITNSSVTLEQRVGRVQEWLKSVDLLLGCVQGDIRDKIHGAREFATERGHIAVPITSPDGASWGLTRHNHSKARSLGLLALFRSDASLHTMFQSQSYKATYFESSRTISFPPRRVSPIWQGILAFHEITHAQNHFAERYNGVDHGHWVEEHDVFRDELKVLHQLYGLDYASAVGIASEQYVHDLQDGSFNAVPRNGSLSNESLDAIMGKSYSGFERGIRRGAANIDAIYTAFDELGRTDHAHVTEWFYGQQ